MFVCVRGLVCIYMEVSFVYVYTHECVCVCVFSFVCNLLCVYLTVCISLFYACLDSFVHMHIFTYANVCVCLCVVTFVYPWKSLLYMCTYMNACVCAQSRVHVFSFVCI